MSKETGPAPSRRQLREAMSAQANASASDAVAPPKAPAARPETSGAPTHPPTQPQSAPTVTAPAASAVTSPVAPPAQAPRASAPEANIVAPTHGRRTQGPRAAASKPVPVVQVPTTPQAGVPATPENAAAPSPSTDVAPSAHAVAGQRAVTPVASTEAAPRERSSQTRARDRAALRAYKELVDGAPPVAEVLPSRRALRQAQLDAERAPVTSINPVVSATPAEAPSSAANVPVAPSAAPQSAGIVPGTAKGEPAQLVDQQPVNPAQTNPAQTNPAQSSPGQSRPEQLEAGTDASTVAGQAHVEPADATHSDTTQSAAAEVVPAPATVPAMPANGPASSAANSQQQPEAKVQPELPAATPSVSKAPASGRRLGRRAAAQLAAEEAAAQTANPSVSAGESGESQAMPLVPASSEANEAVKNNLGVPPAVPSQAPTEEELRELAEQRAAAERTAILEQRAQTRERLLAESAKSRKTPSDPTATNNLAMVTPLEFIDVPGVDRPMLRPPATTHVPIVTSSGPKVPAPGQGQNGLSEAARFDAALSARRKPASISGTAPGRSSTLQRAEQLATVSDTAGADSANRTQMPPMPADYAHGLEPLDAVTAGLGRTQRNLLIQWGSLIVGGAAFVVGAVMLISALAR